MNDLKTAFLNMMKVGRTTAQILEDINCIEENRNLNPQTIPEVLRILEDARREFTRAV